MVSGQTIIAIVVPLVFLSIVMALVFQN